MTGLGSQRMQCCPDRVEMVQGVLQFRESFCSSGSCFAVQGVVLQFRELFCQDHRDKVKKQILISSLQNMMMIDEADDAMVFGNQSPKRKVPEAPASPGPGRKRKPGE